MSNGAAAAPDTWRRWITTLFPEHFTSPPAEHHAEFWDWLWSIEPGVMPDTDFVAIWSRDGGKSTNVEAGVVALGVRGRRNYVLYICETQTQADDHIGNIGRMIESSEVERYYPDFGRPSVGKFGNRQGWRRNRLWTAGGFVIDALGLDVAKRGVKLDEQRPDLIVIDDIDGEHDSMAATQKKIKTLTRKLIPAGDKRSLAVIAVQNLVHRDSVFAQLADGRADFLINRRVSGPHPAVIGMEYEIRHGHAVITAGEPTWSGQDISTCQRLIDKIGIESFLAECQHEVARPGEGAFFPEFSELHHVITESEFARFFESHGVPCHDREGRWMLPGRGRCAVSQDFGTTPKHPCVTGWYWRPGEGMPLGDSVFRYRELCRPRFPVPRGVDDEKVTSRRIGIMIADAERPWREAERMDFRIMSHEASDENLTYQLDMPDELDYGPLSFEKWTARDRLAGIALAQNFIGLDKSEPHPFRRVNGMRLNGRPRFYLIVPDKQGDLYFDEKAKKVRVRQPLDESGQSRFRAEIPRYRKMESQGGAEGKNPRKEFDDAMDEFKAMFRRWGPQIQPLTPEERAMLWIDQSLPAAAMGRIDPGAQVYAQMSRDLHLREKLAEEKQKEKSWLQQLDGWEE